MSRGFLRNSIMACCCMGILAFAPVGIQAQQHYTLQSAIRQAQDSSVVAFMATQDYETAKYAYDMYLSTTGPQVSLNVTPSYYKRNYYADYNYTLPSNMDMTALAADVSFSKQISRWGGTVYAKTRTVWSELLGDMVDSYYGTHRYFGFTPLQVGYKQELLGWNAFRWQRKIESHQNELAKKKFDYKMRQIAEQTANYYFNYVSAKLYCDIYRQNFLSADTLYKVGQKKFMLTTVTKDELMAQEISRTNADNQLKMAEAELQNARISLLSYLHVQDNGQELILDGAEIPESLTIDDATALAMARQNNPLTMELDEKVLAAERDLDEARRRSGLQIGMDISVGVQSLTQGTTSMVNGPWFRPRHYAQASVTFSVPLYDSQLARNRKKKAASALKYAQYASQEQQRQTDDDVMTVINLIRVQQRNIPNARHNVELADAAFELVSRRYADGLSDMNTYQLTLSRKDQAHQIYISLLNNFWTNYYKLTRLTMYDFLNNRTHLEQ